MMVDEKKKDEINIKEIRKKLEAKIEEALPQDFKERHAQAPKVAQKSLEELRQVDEMTAKRIVEAVLFSSSKPVTLNALKKILKGYTPAKIEKLIAELKSEYERDGRSFGIEEVANGFELVTQQAYFQWLAKADVQKKSKSASHAMLETLAVLAYKQPATRAEIEELRGVDSSGVLSTLLDRNFLKIAGRKEVPGRPLLYATTEQFLHHFGLKSLADLPRIAEIKEIVQSAIQKETLQEQQKEQERMQEEEKKREKDAEVAKELAERQKEIQSQYEDIAGSIEDVKVHRENELRQITEPPKEPEPADAEVAATDRESQDAGSTETTVMPIGDAGDGAEMPQPSEEVPSEAVESDENVPVESTETEGGIDSVADEATEEQEEKHES